MESFQRPLRTTGHHRTGHSLRVGISHKEVCTKSAVLACEAGASIKPGAQAPGSEIKSNCEPMKWATARRHQNHELFVSIRSIARIRGLENVSCVDPGACAPGFMLPAASQAETALLVQSRQKA